MGDRQYGEVKVYRATSNIAGLDESKWGRRAVTRFYQDIVDQNDLQRRAEEVRKKLEADRKNPN